MAQLWGARFKKSLDDAAKAFSYSVNWDKRLYKQDIAVNTAHVKGLAKAGILTAEEANALTEALASLIQEFEDTLLNTELPDEDIHSCIERLVIERCGDLGKKMHTGKSRNDQVITDTRLFVKEEASALVKLINAWCLALVALAETHADTPFPGFTHLQTAQPVSLGHHLLAHCEKALRDKKRFEAVIKSADHCALGSAALAGSNYPLDREFLAKELGFSNITQNSMDAVSDRDFILEFLSAASIMALHMSQLCEELILWSSPMLGFIEIGDDFTTGSSIMPQKKNPDMAELVRGKTGSVLAQFISLHECIKGLPLTYNRDLQDDKLALFNSLDTCVDTLTIMTAMLPTININSTAIDKALSSGFILATELADYLVLKGIPFRECHEITGQIVQYAQENGKRLEELSLDEFQKFSKAIEADLLDSLTIDQALCRKNLIGGTAPEQVKQQIARLKELLNG